MLGTAIFWLTSLGSTDALYETFSLHVSEILESREAASLWSNPAITVTLCNENITQSFWEGAGFVQRVYHTAEGVPPLWLELLPQTGGS